MSFLRLGQLQLGRLAILGHLVLFLLRRELIQPGDGPRRLLIRHLEFLAPCIESVRVPLLPLAHPIAVEAVQHLALARPVYQLLLIHSLSVRIAVKFRILWP